MLGLISKNLNGCNSSIISVEELKPQKIENCGNKIEKKLELETN